MVVAALWYPRARGRAIAVADLGTGFGAFVCIPLGQVIADAFGWRATLLAWALMLVAIVIPLNAFQQLPPGARRRSAGASVDSSPAWTVRRAVRSSPFWSLAAMRFCGACAFPVMNVHMVAYAIGHGIAPATAATALGAVSLVSLAGRLATGWLSDHLGRAPALTIAYASAAIGIGCLTMLSITGAPAWLALYVAFYGMAQGSTGIVASARAADVFAGPTFGVIYGWLSLAIGPGEALGTWVGGLIFDVTRSYVGAFAFAVLALAGGVIAIWRVSVPHGDAHPR
jgi:predicted MFS family arabinose efflux permease